MSVPGSSREWVPAVSVQSEKHKGQWLALFAKANGSGRITRREGPLPRVGILSLDRYETVEASLLLVKSTTERP
jgi:hypothetical protein